MLFLSSAEFFEINFFKKLFQEHHQIVKLFGSVGPDLGSKLFAMVISRARQQNVTASKERAKKE